MMKSDSYYRRKDLLESDEFPQQTEINARHDDSLANVMYDFLSHHIKPDLGLSPKLEGPGDDMWISPSDMLIPNVKLKPPFTVKHVQALTHQGILEIGCQVEQKFRLEMEHEKQRAMMLLTDKLNFLALKEKRKAIEAERVRAAMELEYEMNRMEHECEETLKNSLTELENRMLIEQDLKIREERVAVQIMMERKLIEAVIEKARELSEEFEKAFKIQAEAYEVKIKEAISIEEEKKMLALQDALAEKIECLKHLKHDLECRNMANIMYVLSAERGRCANEKSEIHDEYKIIIDEMSCRTLDLYNRIISLENECDWKTNKIAAWEERTLDIIRQFQKFINFALRAVPSQAEFLLNLCNLVKITTKDTERMMSIKFDNIQNIPNRKISLTKTNMVSDFINEQNMGYKITVPERTPPDSKLTIGSSQELPIFYFNKYLYMREDFRNQKSIEQKPAKIWEADTENNTYTGMLSSSINYPIASNVHFSVLDNVHAYGVSDHDHSNKKQNETQDQESYDNVPDLGTVRGKDLTKKHGKLIPISKTKVNISNDNFLPDSNTNLSKPKKQSKLLLARNSLIIHRQSLSMKSPSSVHSYNDEAATKRSKVPSRLSMARNSLEIHRASLKGSKELLSAEKREEWMKMYDTVWPTEEGSDKGRRGSVRTSITLERKPEGTSRVQILEIPQVVIPPTTQPTVAEAAANIGFEFFNLDKVEPQSSSSQLYESDIEEKVDGPEEAFEETKLPPKRWKCEAVLGDQHGIEHKQCPHNFGCARMHSLMNILKKSKSLLRLFTPNQK